MLQVYKFILNILITKKNVFSQKLKYFFLELKSDIFLLEGTNLAYFDRSKELISNK